MSTRHRKPASRAKLVVYGAVVVAALVASVLGSMSAAQAAPDDATSDDSRFVPGRLLPDTQETAPEATPTPDAPDTPDALARQRLPLRPGTDIGDGEVLPPPPDVDPEPDPDPGSYSGGWNGETAVTVHRFPYLESEVDSFNVKDGLEAAWNLGLRGLQTQLAQEIEAASGGKLYDVDVTLANADADSLLSLTVSPKWKSVSLFYMVGGHQMRAKVDADYVSDPTATLDFAIGLRLNLGTDTWPEEPLDLKSADAVMMPDANGVSVDGDWTYKVGTVVRWLKNLGNVDSVEQTIADSFTGQTSNVEPSVQSPVDLLNGDLESLINSLGTPVSAITPRYDDATYRLVLRLDVRPMVYQSPDAAMAR